MDCKLEKRYQRSSSNCWGIGKLFGSTFASNSPSFRREDKSESDEKSDPDKSNLSEKRLRNVVRRTVRLTQGRSVEPSGSQRTNSQ